MFENYDESNKFLSSQFLASFRKYSSKSRITNLIKHHELILALYQHLITYRFLFLVFGFLQIAVYVTFATNSAALQGSLMAVTGQDDFQWMKLCNKFTRFCVQVGGALVCCYLACIVMILLSSLSAFNLFRLYSPKRFMLLKRA